jgi:hypothetical protein
MYVSNRTSVCIACFPAGATRSADLIVLHLINLNYTVTCMSGYGGVRIGNLVYLTLIERNYN